ncbi:cytochrome c [uncultured Mucilaginibacter sp.]|uniref:c-type cytochrome n=1 Tax=uncultured Mucilaginibacter sp. TaxID=797541 RepID=UPI0025DE9387|nr:cytochrome c [uncultured Mucilaginibacter sp.]
MKSKLVLATATLAIGLMTAAFTLVQQPKPWPVPDKNAKMANPVKSSKESIADGKSLWSVNCASCHGKGGLGDGSKAAQLKTIPNDLTKADFQSQSDGAIFYKISEGRDDMPSFKKKLPDAEDIWNLVVYVRTLKK